MRDPAGELSPSVRKKNRLKPTGGSGNERGESCRGEKNGRFQGWVVRQCKKCRPSHPSLSVGRRRSGVIDARSDQSAIHKVVWLSKRKVHTI